MRLTLVDNLVFPVGRRHTDFDVHPNIGLASLAAVARLGGHEVGIIDPKRAIKEGRLRLGDDLYGEAAEVIRRDRPEAVGFTTLGCSFIFTIRVAERLKRMEPELPILLGGPHATMLDRRIMESFGAVDVIVRHEAEDTINPILDGLGRRRFSDIPGITYRTGRTALGIRSNPGAPKIEDLDRLPFPAYDLYPVDALDLPYLRVEAGRGCPWACTFCSTATFFQRSYRLKSPARLVDDLDQLHHRYGYTSFKLEHDLFTVNKRKVAAFCEAVEDRGYTWMASARIDCVDAPLLEAMAASGCRQLYFGIETGSTRLQSSLHKRLDLSLVGPVLSKAADAGIETVASFITGFPDETERDRDDSLSLIGSLVTEHDPAPTVQLHLLLPEPGTGEFEVHGDEMAFDGYVAEFNAEPHREDRELIAANPQIFATYHHYPGLIAREEQIGVVEITRQLLSLGPLVLRQVLAAAGLDLAALVTSIYHAAPGCHGGDAVVSQIARRLGVEHPVTSLVRVRAALGAPAPAPAVAVPPLVADDACLVLSPDALLFQDLHDCGRLIDHLVNEPDRALPEDLATGRHDYVAVRSSGGVRMFEVDPLTLLVASAFAAPARSVEVAERLNVLTDREVPVDAVVAALRRAEALVPAPSVPSVVG